jgi:hypothetical protein
MERIITFIVLCAALAPGAAHAQSDISRFRTCNYMNGRYWKEMGSTTDRIHLVQTAYLMGVMDMDWHTLQVFGPLRASRDHSGNFVR